MRGQVISRYPNVRKESCIGRVYTVHVSSSERYYLRLLLHYIQGPTSFDDLRTINGILFPSFQAACNALGLLENDSCWEETLQEAAVGNSPKKLRDLFCTLIVFCNVSNPQDLWIKFRDNLSEDYLRDSQKLDHDINYSNSPQLYEIISRMCGQSLAHYILPTPSIPDNQLNMVYIRETNYDKAALRKFVSRNEINLKDEQRNVYENVISSVLNPENSRIFFLDAPGGTGKTFLINLILAKVRSESKIALAVALQESQLLYYLVVKLLTPCLKFLLTLSIWKILYAQFQGILKWLK